MSGGNQFGRTTREILYAAHLNSSNLNPHQRAGDHSHYPVRGIRGRIRHIPARAYKPNLIAQRAPSCCERSPREDHGDSRAYQDTQPYLKGTHRVSYITKVRNDLRVGAMLCSNLSASSGSSQACSNQAARASCIPDARERQFEPLAVDPRNLTRSDSSQSNSVG